MTTRQCIICGGPIIPLSLTDGRRKLCSDACIEKRKAQYPRFGPVHLRNNGKLSVMVNDYGIEEIQRFQNNGLTLKEICLSLPILSTRGVKAPNLCIWLKHHYTLEKKTTYKYTRRKK